jgi:uncharacterized protein (DUF2236 family)
MIVKDAGDFYKPVNGAIYKAMVELFDRHASLDIVQLHQDGAQQAHLAFGGVRRQLFEEPRDRAWIASLARLALGRGSGRRRGRHVLPGQRIPRSRARQDAGPSVESLSLTPAYY